MQMDAGTSFAREEVRETVVPTYMGLIKQIDDHVGRVLGMLEKTGQIKDTMIVFTSDHGDLLGDHWLGEKEMFYEASAGVPLIVVNPSMSNQISVCDALVEAIDLIPTFMDALDQPAQHQWLEGQSLLPYLQKTDTSRQAVFSELDYGFYPAARELHVPINEARATMVRTRRWKLVDYQGFESQLFDLQEDPEELTDLGQSVAHASLRSDMKELIYQWRGALRMRTSMSDSQAEQLAVRRNAMKDIVIGKW
jgi:arylsulfatase A-like enzyme